MNMCVCVCVCVCACAPVCSSGAVCMCMILCVDAEATMIESIEFQIKGIVNDRMEKTQGKKGLNTQYFPR